jgi:UTP--glucose-1-phosphate uridylyltransferase
MKLRKAVIPAAGLGTRFLPATKAQPKEMLPLVDKPAIQYVVEEAVRAGLTEILIVTGRGKRPIEDHFDRSLELEHYLEEKGKFDDLKQVREISDMAEIHYIRQKDLLTICRAVAEASVGGGCSLCPRRRHHGRAPPAPDRDVDARALAAARPRVTEVSRAEVSSRHREPETVEERLVRVRSVVEKPDPDEAPSNLAAIGRYVLTPEIFDCLRGIPPGRGGEIQLTDAITLLAQQQAVYAWEFEDGRFDVGNKLDYLKATIELAIDREDLGQGLRDYLSDLVQRKKLL